MPSEGCGIIHRDGEPPERRLERIGHRGIPAERLENTLPSFVLAIELGADSVELDTHVSSDGVVVVHHDETVHGKPIAAQPGPTWNPSILAAREFPRSIRYSSRWQSKATVYVEMKGANVEEQW